MFDQFHITLDVNLALQSRNEIEQVHLLDDIRRTEPAPGLLQGGCRLQMSGSRRHCRDQDAHVELLAESLADGAPERKKIPARIALRFARNARSALLPERRPRAGAMSPVGTELDGLNRAHG